MSNVLNRVTKQYLLSVNTPDYSTNEWIINPDLSRVQEVDNKYWKVVGDSVVRMDDREASAVDANDIVNDKIESIANAKRFADQSLMALYSTAAIVSALSGYIDAKLANDVVKVAEHSITLNNVKQIATNEKLEVEAITESVPSALMVDKATKVVQ